MELIQLEYFYAVAQNLHVSRTAAKLHIAQPSLTASIKRLEQELGVPLLVRSGRGIALTEYGIWLRDALTPILEGIHRLPEGIAEMHEDRRHTIRLNVLAASVLVTKALISYQQSHEGLQFRLIQNEKSEGADITVFTRSFFESPEDSGRFKIFTERIFLAVPLSSPYANRSSVTLREVAEEDFISLSSSHSIRGICDRYCLHAGFAPKIIFESDSPDAVKNLIAAGLGVGFWPEYTWGEADTSSVHLLPISEPECRRDIVLELHRGAARHEEALDFFAFLYAYFRGLQEEAAPN